MKLIFSDLDGTLLSRGETALGRNAVRAIGDLLSVGVKLAVASGRSYVELKHLFSDFENDIYFIASDGALTVYREKTLFSRPITAQSESFALHGKYRIYLKSDRAPVIRDHLVRYGGHVAQIANLSEVTEEVYKMADYTNSDQNALSLVYQDPRIREYVAPGTDKGRAASALMKQLGVLPEDTAAFGDGINDLPMFSAVGTGYAVMNARPDVKRAADAVCDGFSTEIYKLL